MIINKIRIKNFGSLYGVHEFNFNELKGMIKLSGPIGSGKTMLLNSILFGKELKIKNNFLSSFRSG